MLEFFVLIKNLMFWCQLSRSVWKCIKNVSLEFSHQKCCKRRLFEVIQHAVKILMTSELIILPKAILLNFFPLFFLGSCEYWPSINGKTMELRVSLNAPEVFFFGFSLFFCTLAFVFGSGDLNAASGSRSSSCPPLFSFYYHQQNRRVQ